MDEMEDKLPNIYDCIVAYTSNHDGIPPKLTVASIEDMAAHMHIEIDNIYLNHALKPEIWYVDAKAKESFIDSITRNDMTVEIINVNFDTRMMFLAIKPWDGPGCKAL